MSTDEAIYNLDHHFSGITGIHRRAEWQTIKAKITRLESQPAAMESNPPAPDGVMSAFEIAHKHFPGDAVKYSALLEDIQAHAARECAELRAALGWALDILDMNDRQLISMGEPEEKVLSAIHIAGKAKARTALAKGGRDEPTE